MEWGPRFFISHKLSNDTADPQTTLEVARGQHTRGKTTVQKTIFTLPGRRPSVTPPSGTSQTPSPPVPAPSLLSPFMFLGLPQSLGPLPCPSQDACGSIRLSLVYWMDRSNLNVIRVLVRKEEKRKRAGLKST